MGLVRLVLLVIVVFLVYVLKLRASGLRAQVLRIPAVQEHVIVAVMLLALERHKILVLEVLVFVGVQEVCALLVPYQNV